MAFSKIRPSFGAPVGTTPEIARAVRSTVGVQRPEWRRRSSPGYARASFRPLAQTTRSLFLSAVPSMRGEVAGLSESGAQWIVEAGDTGSKIALKLTGNASRWIELRAVNPKIMSRSPALVKQYGFPIYVKDIVNLPASWVKATTTPATPKPSATTPPAIVMPAGDFAAMSQARLSLGAWSISDGANKAGVQPYPTTSDATAQFWTARDVLVGDSFARWWTEQNGVPSVSSGQWSDDLARALNAWSEAKARKITESAAAAGGYVIPTTTTPTVAEKPATVPSAVSGGVTVPAIGGTTITLPSTLGGGTINVAPTVIKGSISGTTSPAAPVAKPSENTANKWAITSIVVSTIGGLIIKATM